MQIDVLTLFPELFSQFLTTSIPGRAAAAGLVSYRLVNFRDFATDKHRSVDDRPFGGGPGMVLMCPPIFDAVEQLDRESQQLGARFLLTPGGKRLDQATIMQLAQMPRIVLICGHYEGFDERIHEGLHAEELSIGDYVLSGGEVAAMVVIDAVVRLIPGVLGNDESPVDESFGKRGLLEYPQYTRPREYRGMTVPDVLISGNHAAIEQWREAQALARTKVRRPDLAPGGAGSSGPDESP